MKVLSCILVAGMLLTSCNMSNTGKGALIGGGSGAAVGAGLGAIFGKGKGAAIGAAVGAAVGTTAGALIGKKMDKAAEQAKQVEGAQVEQVTDNNGLQAVKVTFDSGILFSTSSSTLSASIYRQSGVEKLDCRAKLPKEPEPVAGTRPKRSQLSAGLRRIVDPNQDGRGYGRSQSRSRQLDRCRPSGKPPRRGISLCQPADDPTGRSRNALSATSSSLRPDSDCASGLFQTISTGRVAYWIAGGFVMSSY